MTTAPAPAPSIPRLCLIAVVLLLLSPHLILASTCPAINNGVCPKNRAETAAGNLPLTTCSSKGSCYRGACVCLPGWIDVDCSVVDRRLLLGNMVVTQFAFNDAPTRYSQVMTQTFNATRDASTGLPAYAVQDCNNYIARMPALPIGNISLSCVSRCRRQRR
jgi:hypothetical protein